MCSRVHGGHISSTRVSNMYKFLIWRALNTVVHVTADHSACRWSVRMSRRTGSWCHKHSSQYKVCVHAHCSGHSAEMGSRQVQQMTGMVNTTKQTNTLTQCIHMPHVPTNTTMTSSALHCTSQKTNLALSQPCVHQDTHGSVPRPLGEGGGGGGGRGDHTQQAMLASKTSSGLGGGGPSPRAAAEQERKEGVPPSGTCVGWLNCQRKQKHG